MKKQQSVTLCGETLTGPRHICACFDSREEQYEMLLRYFKEGLDNGEEVTPKYDCTLLCVYDINKFSGRVIADILSSHSHVILNGRIHKNSHFVQPLELLKTLMRRPKRPLTSNN